MDIEKLSISEKINLIEELLESIPKEERMSILELGESTILNKRAYGEEIADDLIFCGKIDGSDLDNAIWWRTDELGGEIKGYVYDYAYENNIEITD